ncbi:MAG TPA: hypothetical protein VFQ95_02445 [Rhodanobacteraceae bacterium]|nr:hypothetical protein [Rhodanobacteraceae bacterium]
MNPETEAAFCSIPEVLLMLRAPGAGWLSTLLAALDEANRDPDFSAAHRAVLAHCLGDQAVPAAIVDAARQRIVDFERSLSTQFEQESQASHTRRSAA